MTDSEIKFVANPFDNSRVKVLVAVKLEGDILAHFRASVEEQFAKHWTNINRAIESRNAWELKNNKLHFNKYLRSLYLEYGWTEAEAEQLTTDDWMHIFMTTVDAWIDTEWSEKEYGSLTLSAICAEVHRYLRTPEAHARFEEWIEEEWLLDLIWQKGINASRKAKIPSEGNLAV